MIGHEFLAISGNPRSALRGLLLHDRIDVVLEGGIPMSSIAGTQHALRDFSEWLDGLRDGDGLWRGDVRSAALRLALLPLYIVREGFYGLRADGAVMLARWQEDPVEVSDVRARVRAIAQAAHQFPALKELLPARPEGALTCSRCRGSGIAPNQTGVACDCDGLGWRPRESA